MPRTRSWYKREAAKDTVERQSVDIKPDLACLHKHIAETVSAAPYKRRYFTLTRKIKAKNFVEHASSNPTAYGPVGSKAWFEELLTEINEPGVITHSNISDWIITNPGFFNFQPEVTRPRQKSLQTMKDAIITSEIKKEILEEAETTYESDTFQEVVKKKISETVKYANEDSLSSEEIVSVKVITTSQPLKFQDIQRAINSTDDEMDIVPYIDLATPSPIAPSTPDTLNVSFNSEDGIHREDRNHDVTMTLEPEDLNVAANVEVNNENMEIDNLSTELDDTTVNEQIVSVLHTEPVPVPQVTNIPNTTSKVQQVLQILDLIVNAFEKAHGLLVEPQNARIAQMFADLRNGLNKLKNDTTEINPGSLLV